MIENNSVWNNEEGKTILEIVQGHGNGMADCILHIDSVPIPVVIDAENIVNIIFLLGLHSTNIVVV